jgi:protein-S-isoprenylcysteine O-methyltransferase Ste14
MNQFKLRSLINFLLFDLTLLIWLIVLNTSFSYGWNLSVIVGAVLLVFPATCLGRLMLANQPSKSRVDWITTLVHYCMLILFGTAVIRAILSHKDWTGWVLPIPAEIGLGLVIICGAASLLSVANLALKGLGLPFAIALSQKLAVDWLYAWTRNPMVLASLCLLVSLGIWYQSALFVLWALFLVSPALLFFVRVYEERELEIRFGAPYLAYKSRTPLLFPRRPGA